MEEKVQSKWITDANQIDAEQAQKLLYTNKVVQTFLSDKNKYFVAANRGMGKTLLLTVKRYKLSEQYAQNNPSKSTPIKFIPENRPFLDTLEPLGWLEKSQLEFLGSVRNSSALWNVSIKLCCCIAFDHITPNLKERIADELMAEVKNPKPTDIFNYLLRYTRTASKLSNLIQNIELPLKSGIDQMNFPVYIFIDKIDQAILSFESEAWIKIQLGLIDAAWRINESNHHIKIYAAIRQEAYASNDKQFDKQAIGGRVSVLNYNKDELQDILNKLVNHYEGRDDLNQFLGFYSVPTSNNESPFEYLLRHGTYRPREFVSVMGIISDTDKTNFHAGRFMQIVNTHTTDIVNNRLAELHPFLITLADNDRLRKLLSAIPHNILTYPEIKVIFDEMNGAITDPEDIVHAAFHPFCELYLCGLLGVVKQTPNLPDTISFRQPKDATALEIPFLLTSSFFFIHPALVEFIKTYGAFRNKPFHIFSWNKVAHDENWTDQDIHILNFSKSIKDIPLNGYNNLVKKIVEKYKAGSVGKQLTNSVEYQQLKLNKAPEALMLSIDDYLVN